VVILNEDDVFTNGRIKYPAIKALEEEPPIVPVNKGVAVYLVPVAFPYRGSV
jgi:hypothetical protein